VLSRLLVGYDGSDGANAAAAFGLWLAATAGCRTTLAHVIPEADALSSADLMAAFAERTVSEELEWRTRLETLGGYAEHAAVDCRVVSGTPAGALIATATEIGADIVLVGSHGAGRVHGALMGSVSAQLLSHATCPVMLFRDDPPNPPAAQARTVVVGIDGSPASRHALEVAQALAVPLGAALVLLHAYDDHVPYLAEPTEGMRAEMRRHASVIVHQARATVTAPLDVVREEVVAEPSRRALVEACERHAPALLVVGSRGLGGFKELLLGGTSRWVADCAPCPVLVARKG
jgi:nucleotide-binding universal stress UspA family protein